MILFTACENLNDPGEAKYKHSLLCNLKVGISNQKIFIYDILSLEEYAYGTLKNFDKYFNPNAQVEIESNGTVYSDFYVTADSENVRYYTSDSLNVFPGQEYKVKIIFEGETITGVTQVPAEFDILHPFENQIISYTNNSFNVTYRWEKSQFCSGYQIQVTYPFLFNGNPNPEYYFHSDQTVDTQYVFTNILRPIDTVNTIISAFDKNYYEHVYIGNESAGLTHAYGYFGSSFQKQVRFIVR